MSGRSRARAPNASESVWLRTCACSQPCAMLASQASPGLTSSCLYLGGCSMGPLPTMLPYTSFVPAQGLRFWLILTSGRLPGHTFP